MKSYIIFLLFTISVTLARSINLELNDGEANTIASLQDVNHNTTLFDDTTSTTTAVGEPQTELFCETTGASPLITDIENTATQLNSRDPGYPCQQTNCGGSKCTTFATHGTASTGLCSVCFIKVDCRFIGDMANKVREGCQSFVNGGMRAGGYVAWTWGDAGGNVIVFHSS